MPLALERTITNVCLASLIPFTTQVSTLVLVIRTAGTITPPATAFFVTTHVSAAVALDLTDVALARTSPPTIVQQILVLAIQVIK